MYNRYIPQSDGSYRKRQFPDPAPPRQRSPHPVPPRPKPETQPEKEDPCVPPCKNTPKPSHYSPEHHRGMGAGDFLRRLLPKDLDTGDLLVIILLLLMAGDCKEEKNTALLTLALYMLM